MRGCIGRIHWEAILWGAKISHRQGGATEVTLTKKLFSGVPEAVPMRRCLRTCLKVTWGAVLGTGIHREVPDLITHSEATRGCSKEAVHGDVLFFGTCYQSSRTLAWRGKRKSIHRRSNASYWDSDLRMLWEAARRDMMCSAGAQGEEQVRPGRWKPLPPLMSFQSTPLININLMLVCKGEIFSPALFLHSRQWKVDLEAIRW